MNGRVSSVHTAINNSVPIYIIDIYTAPWGGGYRVLGDWGKNGFYFRKKLKMGWKTGKREKFHTTLGKKNITLEKGRGKNIIFWAIFTSLRIVK